MDQSAAPPQSFRNLAPAAYALAGMLFLIPFSELAAQLQWNILPSATNWRVGAVGVVSSAPSPVVAVFLALATAHFAGHRKTLQILSALTLFAMVILTGIMTMFMLDYLQIRRDITPELSRVFDVNALKAATNLFLMTVTLGTLGVTGLRCARTVEPSKARGRTTSAVQEPLLARGR